jgi:hypothetical protein
MRAFSRLVLTVSLGLSLALPAAAQEEEATGDEAPVEEAAPAAEATQKEGHYGGVVPGQVRATPPGAPKKGKRARRPLVTWIGFQAQGEGARVFVQLSQNLGFDQAVVGDELVVTIRGAVLGTPTHGKFIDTSFFDTKVVRVEAKNRGKTVELRVRFKKGAVARADARVEKAADGQTYLFLDF